MNYRIAKWYPKVGKTIPAQAAFVIVVDDEGLIDVALPTLHQQHQDRPIGSRPLLLIEPLH